MALLPPPLASTIWRVGEGVVFQDLPTPLQDESACCGWEHRWADADQVRVRMQHP